MIDREKVLVGLAHGIEKMDSVTNHNHGFNCIECPYYADCDATGSLVCVPLMRDALELLKAQEPRVMTLEEVTEHNNQDGCVWFEQPTYNPVAAFVRKEEFEIEVISPYILGNPINHGYWLSSNYNVAWRCWTSRPTDEQREAIPWMT